MTSVDSGQAFAIQTGAVPFRKRIAGAELSTADAARMIAKPTPARVSFALMIAVLSSTVLPWQFTLAWGAFMTAWELAIRPLLDREIAMRLATRNEGAGVRALALINFLGGCAYQIFPLVAWSSGSTIGMVFAVAWICGAANHAFVYFFSHRTLLIAVLTPVVGVSVAAPFLTSGLTLAGVAAMITLVAMIAAAGLFGRDREFLLDKLAEYRAAHILAEQASTAKSQFMALMSHELRTPLNAIIGYAELIEEDAPGSVADDAGKIRGSARQLLGIINIILDVSKLESGEVKLQFDRVAVSEILEQLGEGATRLAAANNNSFTITPGSALGEADLDHARLYQCLMHLIGNAAKFTRNGEITLAAARVKKNGAPAIEFTLSDTGIGVPAHMLERIFLPFVQVETSDDRRFEGAGLGLAFAHRVVQLMGGDVTCDSVLGQGSTFTLWVPAKLNV